MQFSLQDMIRRTIFEAEEREKTAQAAEESLAHEKTETASQEKKETDKNKPPVKPTQNTATAPARNEDDMMNEEGEKVSSAFVEKLASAVSYCNGALFKVAEPEGSPMGPGKGPNTLPISESIGGQQSYNTGQAKHNQPPMRPGPDVASPGQTNPATALETDINDTPGGTEKWDKNPVMKQAAVNRVRALAKMAKAPQQGDTQHTYRSGTTPLSPLMGAVKGGVTLGALGALAGAGGGATLGEGVGSSLLGAAIGGLGLGAIGAGGGATLSALKRTQLKSDKRQIHNINKQSSVDRVNDVLRKMAEDALNPAQIKAQHNDVPPNASVAGEGVPSQPAETTQQKRLITSLDDAINYTKQQAKAVPKKRMGEVLNEPAQRKSTDPVLQENLNAASSAGVKIAAARSLLQKVAEEGAAPDATPEQKSRSERLAAILKAKKEEKKGSDEKSESLPLQGGY